MALEFVKATEQLISLANSSTLSPGAGDFSIFVRFKTSFNFNGAGTDGYFFQVKGVDTDNSINFSIGNADNKLFGRYRDGDANQVTASGQDVAVNDGAIHTAIWVRDGTKGEMFLDGLSIGSQINGALGTITVDDGVAPYIAANTSPASHWFDGDLIEMRIYKRALTVAETKILHSAQGHDNIVNSMTGRWLMNEKPDGETADDANSVIDISGNGNHGTPANNPVYRASLMKLVRPIVSGIGT